MLDHYPEMAQLSQTIGWVINYLLAQNSYFIQAVLRTNFVPEGNGRLNRRSFLTGSVLLLLEVQSG